jgi:PRD1 phage membrane DNA delivery
MGDQLISSVTTVLLAIVGIAVIAVIVSKNANTSGVLSAGGSAFSGALAAAEAPVTGGSGLNSAGTYGSSGFMV